MASSTHHSSKHTEAPANVEWTLLDDIRRPGVYVCRTSGDLLRVPAVGQTTDVGELLEKHGTDSIYVTRISADPFIPITRARLEAANRDIQLNF